MYRQYTLGCAASTQGLERGQAKQQQQQQQQEQQQQQQQQQQAPNMHLSNPGQPVLLTTYCSTHYSLLYSPALSAMASPRWLMTGEPEEPPDVLLAHE